MRTYLHQIGSRPDTRNYGATVLAGYRECLEIAKASGVELHLAHMHVNFPLSSGRVGESLDIIDSAAAVGVDVSFDTYPYTARATALHAIMPFWAIRAEPTRC